MDNYGYQGDDNNGRPYTISRGGLVSGGDKQVTSQEFLVGVNSRFKPERKITYYQRTTIVLAFLILVLIIGLLVLLILYLKPNQKESICTSDKCIRTAANLRYSINFSVDPCDNFYEFCCGKWSKEHPNHGWYSSFSTFTTISEKVLLESLDILKTPENNKEPLSVSQAKRFYQSCIDTETIDELGLEPMYEQLKKLQLPIVPTFFTKLNDSYNFDWIKTEVLLKTVLAMDVFIGFTIQPNIFNRSQNVMYIGVLYQSCPLPSPLKKRHYLRGPGKSYQRSNRHRVKMSAMVNEEDDDIEDEVEDEEEETLRTLIRTNMIKYVTKTIMEDMNHHDIDESLSQEAAHVINNMTYYLDDLNANFSLPEDEGGEEETRKVTFDELQLLTDNNVKNVMPKFWINYVESIFESTNVSVDPAVDFVYITETEMGYLWSVLEYISKQSSRDLELYLWWASVYSMIINTSSDIAEYMLTEASSLYAGSEDSVYSRSRSLDCCDLVNTYMGWAVSYAMADKSFTNSTKPKVEKMISDIKDAFVQHVKTLKWMDDYTKQVTLEKSKEMLSFVGYPDWLFKNGSVDKKYEGLEVNSTTYLDNMINSIVLYTRQSLTSLRNSNPRDWSTEAIIVNAYNSFMDNAINVPMAILNYPLYDLGLEVLNYGSIGSILGHELTHGFDNTGRKHDKYGNYIQWWSNKTIGTFENMTKCFVNQYDNYTIDGVKGHVKGKVTLGENLADNGGLNQAYMAYQRYKKRNGAEEKLPGFETYNDEEMFFIAYGSIWCETATVRDLENQLEYDEHAPNNIRVIGTLQNAPEFSKAFQCPENSPMNPTRPKCKIW